MKGHQVLSPGDCEWKGQEEKEIQALRSRQLLSEGSRSSVTGSTEG